jgi:hypothetical protein
MKRLLLALLFAAPLAAQTTTPNFQSGTINECSTTPVTVDATGQAFLNLTPAASPMQVCNFASIAEQL